MQGLKTICSSGNKPSEEVRADPLLAEELNTFYGHFECNGGSVTLPISALESSRQSSDDHVITVSEDVLLHVLLFVCVLIRSYIFFRIVDIAACEKDFYFDLVTVAS